MSSLVVIIPEIYRCHLEEFQSLWEHRYELWEGSDLTVADVEDWDSRIREHLDGLLVSSPEAVDTLQAAIAGGDSAVAFAAAFVLIRLGVENAAHMVVDALFRAEGDLIEKLERALCCISVQGFEQRLVEAVVAAPAANAVAAATVLAVHGRLDPQLSRLAQLFADEDPEVRKQAWRLAALQDAAP